VSVGVFIAAFVQRTADNAQYRHLVSMRLRSRLPALRG
jgi:hypothetical protein